MAQVASFPVDMPRQTADKEYRKNSPSTTPTWMQLLNFRRRPNLVTARLVFLRWKDEGQRGTSREETPLWLWKGTLLAQLASIALLFMDIEGLLAVSRCICLYELLLLTTKRHNFDSSPRDGGRVAAHRGSLGRHQIINDKNDYTQELVLVHDI